MSAKYDAIFSFSNNKCRWNNRAETAVILKNITAMIFYVNVE